MAHEKILHCCGKNISNSFLCSVRHYIIRSLFQVELFKWFFSIDARWIVSSKTYYTHFDIFSRFRAFSFVQVPVRLEATVPIHSDHVYSNNHFSSRGLGVCIHFITIHRHLFILNHFHQRLGNAIQGLERNDPTNRSRFFYEEHRYDQIKIHPDYPNSYRCNTVEFELISIFFCGDNNLNCLPFADLFIVFRIITIKSWQSQ